MPDTVTTRDLLLALACISQACVLGISGWLLISVVKLREDVCGIIRDILHIQHEISDIKADCRECK